MQNIQEVFNRIQTTKKEQKNIREQYKDTLSATTEYAEVVEKLQGYKLRKLQLETEVKAELGSQYEKLEILKNDITNDQELLTDLALSTLMKGETVEIKDKDGVVYEPVFKVSFKKANQVEQRSE